MCWLGYYQKYENNLYAKKEYNQKKPRLKQTKQSFDFFAFYRKLRTQGYWARALILT